MAKSPMVEKAFEILEREKSGLAFSILWDKIIEELNLNKNEAASKIAKLYSNMTLDKRFISLEDNVWDLRKHHKLEELLTVEDDIMEDDEEDEDFLEEDDKKGFYDDEGYDQEVIAYKSYVEKLRD